MKPKTNVVELKRVIPFQKEKVTKADWGDAECFECGHGFGHKKGIEYAYTYYPLNHGGLQLCQKCFDELEVTEK